MALFARELLLDNSNARHRRGARDALSLDHEGFGGLPDSISDLLAERLEGLDAPALDVARVLACAGSELDQTILEEVIGCQEGLWESVEVLAAAGVAGVSGRRGGTADSVALSHPLIGEVVLGRLAPSARQHLHERLGSALRQAGRPSSVLALHYARADPAVGGDGVIDILATGARELLARGAFVEAAGCLEAALGRVLSGSSVARRAGLLEDLGTAWFGLAEPAAAATFWLEALGSMPEDGAAVSLRMRVADAMFLSGRPAESVAQARLAVDVVEGNHAPPMRARFGLLRAALRAADVDAARTAAAPMAGRLGGTDDPAEVMMSGAARASLAMLDNRPRHAYRVAIGALDAAGACEGDRGLVRVARDLEDLALWSAMWLGDLPVIRRHAESSLSLSAGQGHPGFRWRGLAGRFVADFLAGAWDDASDALVELDALTAEGIPGLSRFVPLCHAALELPRGDPDICRQLVGQLEWAMAREAEPDPEAAVSVGAVVALLHLHDGEPAAAWARCAPWAGTRCPSGLPPWADLAAAEAALAAGRHDDARRLADSLEADLPGRSYVGVLARSLRARARSGGPDQTELLGAAEEFAIMGMPYEAARARRLSGKKSQAGAALATFERLGATAEAQRVRDAIDAAGAGSECAGRRTLSIRREGWVPTSL
ncbi:MAG: hypothetical protein ACREPA_12575, partial [Candidatus Dormibacteraceae bacterium]